MRVPSLVLLVLWAGCAPAGSSELELERCRVGGGAKALCGSYRVFENRDAGKGRSIDLRIVVLPAKRPGAPDPILFLHGGPGGSATALAPFFADSELRDQRDVVLIDQRGTGGSNGLDCDFGNLQSQFELLSNFDSSSLAACREAQDADFDYYNTTLAVEDLEEVRLAMGWPAVNLIGGSYGTRVALEYMRRYPESVRTATLRGVAPPSYNVGATFARDSQRALDRVLGDCSASPRCREAFPRLSEELDSIVERLEQRAESATIRDPFAGGAGSETEVSVTPRLFASVVHYSLYTVDGAARLPARIHAAFEGDFAPLIEHTARLAAATAPQFSDGAMFSAVCAEDVPFYDARELAESSRGTLLGDTMSSGFRRACEKWPTRQASASFKLPVESDVPTLLISGAADPVTPPEAAEEAARHLSERLHVVLPEGAHSDLWPGCVRELISRFIERGAIRGLNPSCAAAIGRPAFRLSP